MRARSPTANSRLVFSQALTAGAGVLLFVSLGERYAELIADREAHARVGQETWDRILAGFTAGAQSGHVADAAVAAIEACGAALESHPPR
jgi:putative membrane protein